MAPSRRVLSVVALVAVVAGCQSRYVTRVTVKDPDRVKFEQRVGVPEETASQRSVWKKYADGRTIQRPWWHPHMETARDYDVAIRNGELRMAVNEYTLCTPLGNVEKAEVIDSRGGTRPLRILGAGFLLIGGGIALTRLDSDAAGIFGGFSIFIGSIVTLVGLVEGIRPRDGAMIPLTDRPITPP